MVYMGHIKTNKTSIRGVQNYFISTFVDVPDNYWPWQRPDVERGQLDAQLLPGGHLAEEFRWCCSVLPELSRLRISIVPFAKEAP